MSFIINLFKTIFGIFGLTDRPTSKIHVTCIGVGNSRKYGKCDGASLDASNMYNIFKDITNDCKLILDSQATKSNLISSFMNGSNSDLNILYYSGHGGSQSTSDKFEVDKKDEYLCLYDSSMVDNELWSLINKCKGRVLLIFDCCHSETMFRSPIMSLSNPNFLGEPLAPKSPINMLCWSGCPDNSYSYGGSTGGLFTNGLIKVYKNHKYESYDSIFKRVSRLSSISSYENIKQTKYGSGWNVRVFH